MYICNTHTHIYSIILCTINYTLSVTYLYPWCRHTRWYPCDTRGMLLHHPSGIRLCRPSPREDMASPKPCWNHGETMGKWGQPRKWVAMGINGILIHFNGADTQPLGQRSNRLRPQYSNWNQSQVNDSSLAFTQRKRGFTEAMLSIPLTEVSLSAPYSQTHPKFERSWTIIF